MSMLMNTSAGAASQPSSVFEPAATAIAPASVGATSATRHSTTSSANYSAFQNPPGALSPSSMRTSSSFRSPTMWANFEDSDDYDGESGPSHSPGGTARPLSKEMNASSDMETRNLLDADATSEASEVPSLDEDPYVMSDEQRLYYTAYFYNLMEKTTGVRDPSAALAGSHPQVLAFFRKSQLDKAALSQIWALADVNKDGYLNVDEFCIAFHLIVVHTKGALPLPEYLPAHVAPAPTPPRVSSADLAAAAGATDGSSPLSQAAAAAASANAIANDADADNICEFSMVPPSVAEKPVPVKASVSSDTLDVSQHAPGIVASRVLPLSPATPKGPPPKPPPRPPRQGHARSASLDLTQGKQPPPFHQTPGTSHQQTSSDIAASAISVDANKGALPPTNMMGAQTLRLSGGAAMGADSSDGVPAVLDTSAPPSARLLMQQPHTAQVESGTQTDHQQDAPDVGLSRRPTLPAMVDFDKGSITASVDSLQAAVDEATPILDWAGKCDRLRRANAVKERELAKLAQIRLQLEMKLAEWRLTPAAKTSHASANVAPPPPPQEGTS